MSLHQEISLEAEICEVLDASGWLYAAGDATHYDVGYNIMEAQNGREAIQAMRSHNLSGAFLDVTMPDLSGFEVLREIRRNPSTGMEGAEKPKEVLASAGIGQ